LAEYHAKGDEDRAIAGYSEAISLDPNYALAFYGRANSWQGKRDNDRAIADFNESIRRGRRPKPTRMKVLTGNPGKRPLNRYESRPNPVMPDCPPELGPAAQREWARLVGELSSLNMVTNLDRAALATYCGAYALRKCRQALLNRARYSLADLHSCSGRSAALYWNATRP
jgi:tetratricopeptide (TPR) repeat protein